jgi:hypothetical protein
MRAASMPRLAALAFVGWIAVAPAVSGQPVTERVLRDADMLEEDGCDVIQVAFQFPVQYISHFPPDAGDELLIQVKPIIVNQSDRAALLLREAVRPPRDDELGVLSIVYDGQLASGPTLTLVFRRPLSYSVGQGRDFRSILIAIPGPDRATSCLPTG